MLFRDTKCKIRPMSREWLRWVVAEASVRAQVESDRLEKNLHELRECKWDEITYDMVLALRASTAAKERLVTLKSAMLTLMGWGSVRS